MSAIDTAVARGVYAGIQQLGASHVERPDARETAEIRELTARDREVRAHEQAHARAAGSLALGGPSYDFELGPDGRRYAVGGEVRIDTAPVADDPEATIEKAERIIRAALAPSAPSPEDRRVAAAAAAMAATARAELAQRDARGDGGLDRLV